MTYKESEFPQILEILLKYSKKEIPVKVLLELAYQLYKKVPIYIGIVGMCLENSVIEVKKENIKKKDLIVAVDKDKIIEGEVERVSKDGNVILKNVNVINKLKNLKIQFNDRKLYKIEKNILEKLWPTLNFKKK